MAMQLAQIGVLPATNFTEADEAPDLNPHHPFDEAGHDLRLDEDGEPLF
jgi:hypothetical protein